MKPTITSFLLLFSLTQVISQSPYSLDTNAIDIVFGNYGYYSGSKVVQVTNVDSIVHPLVWEVGALPEGVHVSIVDGTLTYASDMKTICGNSIVPLTQFSPGSSSPLGFYQLRIDTIEQLKFPAEFSIFIVDPQDCDIKIDSVIVTLNQAPSEDYNISFDKEEIDIRLNENTGMIEFPHEEQLVFNSLPYYLNIRWRINDASLPEEILFLVNPQLLYSQENEIGQHTSCNMEDKDFIVSPTIFGIRFSVKEIDATALEDWSGFPYQFNLDLMLPDFETVLDSVVVNLLNGTTSTDDFEQAYIGIYPNPAANTLFIDSDHDISKISITDIKGQLQFETLVNRIDISDLKVGVYIASIMDQNGNVVNRKFIVE
ncbi:MAG: hypothetical protein ACJA1A_001324 [Saprospiraceae bacterium]|jgi:hypothetical protein